MVARFEEELGLMLFDRKTKPITITKEGEVVLKQIKRILTEVEGLEDTVNALKDEMSGTCRIGVIPTVGPYLLPLFLQSFIQQFPKIHFEISEITTEKMIRRLLDRSLDIGIASLPFGEADLEETIVYHEPFIFFDSIKPEEANTIDIQKIDFNRFWILEEGHCMRTQVESICNLKDRLQELPRNLDFKVGSVDTLLKFVKRNEGNTLLPYLATLDLTPEEQDHLYRLKRPVAMRAIGLVTHPRFLKRKVLEKLEQSIHQGLGGVLENKRGLVVGPYGAIE